jgi:aspartyl-tRNA(Asn)/glutamyl-tRNA(Gln) amidotransferase subunit B
VDEDWIEAIRVDLPELPLFKKARFMNNMHLSEYQANVLCNDLEVADYFEKALTFASGITPQQVANWLTGDVFAYLNQNDVPISSIQLTPDSLVHVIEQVELGKLSRVNGRQVIQESLSNGKHPDQIIKAHGLEMMTDESELSTLVSTLIAQYPGEATAYRSGKTNLLDWFLGQAMRQSHGKADPGQLRGLLQRFLDNPDEK